MNSKKIISMVLIISIFMSLLPSFVFSMGGSGEIRPQFDDSGNLILSTYDRKATSSIRYRNIGWTIFNSDRTKSVVIPFGAYDSDEYNVGGITYVRTYFKTSKDIIFSRIGSVDSAWQKDLYTNGGDLIFDSVMTVTNSSGESLGGLTDNGANHWGEVYYTYDGIEGARGWAQPDGLKSHFNITVHMDAHPEMLSTITAKLTAVPNPASIMQGSSSNVVVSLDSSASVANLKGTNVPITKWRYWASTDIDDLSIDSKGVEGTSNKCSITVPNVYPNAVIYCKVRAFSQKFADEGIMPSYDEAVTQVDIGVILSRDVETGSNSKVTIHSHIYDVLKGIPVKEDLHTEINVNDFYYDLSYDTITSTTIKRDVVGSVNGHSTTTSVTVTRPVKYYVINDLSVYKFISAKINNGAFPGGVVNFNSAYPPPDVNVSMRDEHVNTSNISDTINIGSDCDSVEELKNEAANYIKSASISVKNDGFSINGTEIFSFESASPFMDDPNFDISVTTNKIEKITTIPDNTLNKIYQSTGSLTYKRFLKLVDGEMKSTSDFVEETLNGINSVTVHAPVVCYASVWNDTAFNQELKPDSSKASLILDRPSKISLPTTGQHRNINGYGNRDYIKYTKDKQVKFPFDVYIGTTYRQDGKFLKANTWYSVPLDSSTMDFYLPTWVDEGNYSVEFREICVNAPDISKTENLANMDMSHYVALKNINVRVIGRLYGFKVTDISDYPTWQSVFRSGNNTTNHSDNYYWVGTKDQNGNNRGNATKYTLPVLEGSHPTLKNVGAVKTGYKFKFELDTIGNYFNNFDCIDITPKFYFVGADGKSKQDIDLYYCEQYNGRDNYFIKIDNSTTGNRLNTKYLKLGDIYRNVPESEITNTSRILGISKDTFRNQDAKIGWYDWMVLSKDLRTFKGDSTNLPSGVNADRVIKSKQKWYGEYYLPNSVFAVPKGYNVAEYARQNNGLDGSESIWLKSGYIVVNFDIQTVKNQDFSNPVLSYYKAQNANMWQIEGFSNSKKDNNNNTFTLNNGDIIFYYANKKASDDYSGGGTH